KDRFATIQQFSDALDRSLAGTEVRQGWPARAGLALSAAVVAVALGLAWFGHASRPHGPLPALPPTRGPSRAPRPDPAQPQARTPPGGIQTPTPEGAAPAGKDVDDPLKEELKRVMAEKIWKERGSPEGAAGEAIRLDNWFEAERRVDDQLNTLAYGIWQE